MHRHWHTSCSARCNATIALKGVSFVAHHIPPLQEGFFTVGERQRAGHLFGPFLMRSPNPRFLTQHAQGRTGDCPGPCEEATQRTTCPQKHSEAGGGRPECGGEWAAKAEKRPPQQSGVPTTGLRQRENDTSRNTGRSRRQNAVDPTQHAKGRTGDCPGARKETATRRNVTQGGTASDTKPESKSYSTGSKITTMKKTLWGALSMRS